MTKDLREAALEYHRTPPAGKLAIVATKPMATQRDLALAYSPGVAEACNLIVEDPLAAASVTTRGNLVAVITNGTAVLGLGAIGPLASKPVMEGKAVLFKKFAGVDVFDIEVDATDPDRFVDIVSSLEPTFGGINLEDIKAPECFEIEKKLRERMNIPVFHDDQHGTAIIVSAAVINGLRVVGKDIADVKLVTSGAGAAALACVDLLISLGVNRSNVWVTDIAGVAYKGRTELMDERKAQYAQETDARTLDDVIAGADIFLGLSAPRVLKPEMVGKMADRPLVFALANPTPEIMPEEVKAVRPDAIIATGRSDFPNQVNNVLGFPFIFRGALDVRATTINEAMKLASARALAELTKQDVPDEVLRAYGLEQLHFGPDYIIPKPFDPRVLIWEASAVAQAAMESGVAQIQIDLDEYREQLEARLGKSHQVMRIVRNEARRDPKRVVFPEGESDKVLRAAQVITDEGFAHPVLLGDRAKILKRIGELDLHLAHIEIIDLDTWDKREEYTQEFYRLRQRKGVTADDAHALMRDPTTCAAMMVHLGAADTFVAGVTQNYPDTARPALQILHTREDVHKVAGVFIVMLKEQIFFFADTTANIDPTAEELAEIAIMTSEVARRFHVEPRVAMLSYSDFGSARHPSSKKVADAVGILRKKAPDLMVDGEMAADTAVLSERVKEMFPFSSLKGGANVLIFPDLNSANIAYKLLDELGNADCIGPILTGLSKPVQLLNHGCDVDDIVNITAIASVEAQQANI